MGEFDLIARYFQRSPRRADVALAVGDDCALLELPADHQLAISTDTLVVSTHFLPTIAPADLAYKAVAVNLSDLAGMGATPKWISLALTLPEIDHHWLNEFSQSLFQILADYDVDLIGGDTTKGALSLTLSVQGSIPKGRALCRHHAKVGDAIYVSGTLGDSAAGLAKLLQNPTACQHDYLIQRHLRPTPRIALGQLLTQFSQCAIDISDGLLADLGHILSRSQCGAEIELTHLPLSGELIAFCGEPQAEHYALTGGEDYELCFTVPPEHCLAFEQAVKKLAVKCQRIGTITAERGIQLHRHGKSAPLPSQIGFDHFR